MLHTAFIQAFRDLCPKDWRIYAETCLNVPRELIPAAAAAVDWFFVDIKDMDPAIYKAYTGRDNALVKENLSLLLSLVGPDRITVRVPHIPGFNTDAHVAASVAELEAMGVTKLDVFTYKDPAQRNR